MRIDILTLFPEAFAPLFYSICARAQEKDLVRIELHQLRRWGVGKQAQVDDAPFGGGPGMVLKPEPLFEAIEEISGQDRPHRVFLTPQGRTLTQEMVRELSQHPRLLLVCGHYEGIDHRVREQMIDQEISIGDYVLSGGELAAMVVADAVIRQVPGVIKAESYQQDSFFRSRLDHPHYTRPAEYRGFEVPSILLEGHHAKIEAWREEKALEQTRERRPELLKDNRKNRGD